MDQPKSPSDFPEWHALRRESALVCHLLGSGSTALGRANYADKTGEYYTAFFALSVGLERLAKLVLVADYALSNSGNLPRQNVVSKFGHKLADLMDAANAVQVRHNIVLKHSRPQIDITTKIVDCLDAFADARRGRYANFAALGDPNLGQEFEPISKWWTEVAELILGKHYYGKPPEKLVNHRATMLSDRLSNHTFSWFVNENEETMDDLLSTSTRMGQTHLVQTFGRYYTLTIVRWLSYLFSELCDMVCPGNSVGVFSGHGEHLNTCMVDDSFLKTRKVWPLGS
jgi:hypothetical protein